MLTIRLARTGKRNKAQFKMMLQERTIAPGGRHVEILGSYDPHSKQAVLKAERIKYWIEKGAFVSDTAHNLLVKNGVIADKKRMVKLPAKAVAPEAEAPKEAVADAAAETVAPAAEEAAPAEKAEEPKAE